MLAVLAPSLGSATPLRQEPPESLQPQLQSVPESFAERAPLNAADHSQCILRCHERYDSFLIVNATHKAGLDDRLTIIRVAHELASSLCARLVLATPHDMLTEHHNHGEVQKVWWWDRYFDLPLHPSILMMDQLDLQALPAFEAGPTIGRAHFNEPIEDGFEERLATDYAEAAGSTVPFVWNLTLCWLDWTMRAATLVPELCKDHKEHFGPSSTVSLAASTAKEAMGLTDGNLYTLHVRRTDASNECNTTVSRVVEYMQCADEEQRDNENSTGANASSYSCAPGRGEFRAEVSTVRAPSAVECCDYCDEDQRCVGFDVIFHSSANASNAGTCRLYGPNTPRLGDGGVDEWQYMYCSKPKLVLFTDETDENYISELTTELAKLPQWGGGVIHGDRVIESLLDPSDRCVTRLESRPRAHALGVCGAPLLTSASAAVAETDNSLIYAVASKLMADSMRSYKMHRRNQCDCSAARRASLDEDRAARNAKQRLPNPLELTVSQGVQT